MFGCFDFDSNLRWSSNPNRFELFCWSNLFLKTSKSNWNDEERKHKFILAWPGAILSASVRLADKPKFLPNRERSESSCRKVPCNLYREEKKAEQKINWFLTAWEQVTEVNLCDKFLWVVVMCLALGLKTSAIKAERKQAKQRKRHKASTEFQNLSWHGLESQIRLSFGI